MMTTSTIQVLLADDHPAVRQGLQGLFGLYPEFSVVAEAWDGLTAVSLFAFLRPDVALIDLRMPGQGGIATIKAIRSAHPKAGLIAFTADDDDASVCAALAAGADGFLVKGVPASVLLDAVRTVYAGGKWFAPNLAAHGRAG